MKLMLNLSLALMLAAGAMAGKDFMRMYQSGDINRIYAAEHPEPGVHAAVSLPATIQSALQTVSAKVENIVFEPELYSRAALEPEQEIVAHIATPSKNSKPKKKKNEVEIETIKARPVEKIETKPVDALADITVIEQPVKKKKFKLSMYSRGRINYREAEAEANAATDSLTGKEAESWVY